MADTYHHGDSFDFSTEGSTNPKTSLVLFPPLAIVCLSRQRIIRSDGTTSIAQRGTLELGLPECAI